MKPVICNTCPYKNKCVFDAAKNARLGFVNHIHCVYFKDYEKDKKRK